MSRSFPGTGLGRRNQGGCADWKEKTGDRSPLRRPRSEKDHLLIHSSAIILVIEVTVAIQNQIAETYEHSPPDPSARRQANRGNARRGGLRGLSAGAAAGVGGAGGR